MRAQAILLVVGAVALGAGLHATLSPPPPAATAPPGAPARTSDATKVQDDARPPIETAPKPATGPAVEPVKRNLRDVTPSGMVQVPRPQSQTVVRLPAIAPPAPPPRPPKPRRWARTRVLSAGMVQSAGVEIRIAGIEALPGDAQCGPATGGQTTGGQATGGQWPCGNFARAALQRLLRGRPIECDPVNAPAAASGETRTLATRCEIDGRDIGEWLVSRGWARPAAAEGGPGGSGPYDAALATAKAGRLGQWGDAPAPVPAAEPVSGAAPADY